MSYLDELPELPELSGVLIDSGGPGGIIRPGDTVVFSTLDRTPQEQLTSFRDAIAAKLPGVTVVLLNRARFEAIYRPESTPDEVDEVQ